MAAIVTCSVPEIDALIVFPTLGAPQILPVEPKECTIIIATNIKGYNELRNPCKGAVLVNHHLRLIRLHDDKANLPFDKGPCDFRLYSAIDEDYYYPGKKNTQSNGVMLRKEYIEINELILLSNNLLCKPKKDNNDQTPRTERIIGRLSPEARGLYGSESFDYYFAITLKKLSTITPGRPLATPSSWAWIVTSKLSSGHRFKDSKGEWIPEEKWPSFMKPFHQPLDRLIYNKFQQLANDPSVNGSLLDVSQLYEIPVDQEKYLPPQTDKPFRRVQAWHPVLTSRDNKPLILGHLTDPHISVRAATIAKSPARVIDDDRAGRHYEKVGSRLAHTYKSFKALIDEMAGKADALAITGDAIDFNRNLDPQHIKKEEPTVGEVWSILNVIANVRKKGGGYRRGVDQLYLYSLFMYALRECQLCSFYITGNHEGYQWPYGISPRILYDPLTAVVSQAGLEVNYTAEMNSPTNNDKEANEKVRAAQLKVDAANKNVAEAQYKIDAAQAAGKTVSDELAQKKQDALKQLEQANKDLTQAQQKAANAAQKLTDFINRNIERASAYQRDKASECIPSDHNVTIYEACLAYGPTYGQLISAHNFRREQFDWIHWLYTPFSDLNVYPCCTDLVGNGAKQALTLLGWGEDERMHADLLYAPTGNKKGADRREFGFLPWACESINETQREIIETAARVKTDESIRWTVLTHFTIANFRDCVPASVVPIWAGFVTKRDEPDSDWFASGDTNAQYNYFNWGGCEKGLLSFLSTYVGLDNRPRAKQIDLHICGHSHRSGVYILRPRKMPTEKEVQVNIECSIPQFPRLRAMPGLDAGTHFVVGTTAGPMGKQAVSGWGVGGWTDNEKRKVGKAEWNALLGGWITRPPSGLSIDTATNKLTYVKAPDHEKRNDLPRLAVMLDYREVMSLLDEAHVYRPIVICPTSNDEATRLGTGLPVELSKEIKALDCLDLKKIKVWVYKAGAPQSKKTIGGSKGDTTVDPTPAAKGGWAVCDAWVRDDTLFFEGAGKVINDAFTPWASFSDSSFLSREIVLCAFMEIPLQEPKHPDVPWDEVKWKGESWVFPVDIERSRVRSTNAITCETLRRGDAASGEIPNWEFLRQHCGYPGAKDVISPSKSNSTSTQKS